MVFDPLYFIIVGPFILLSLWASFYVKSTFNKYSRYSTQRGITGKEAAEIVLRAGNTQAHVERIGGFLTDHYDPSQKVLRLSPEVHDSPSLSAVGVAAHEAGHAIQDKEGYFWLGIRTALVPTASIGGNFSWILIFLGFLFGSTGLILLGIALFAAVVLFQIVTLPVEFDASRRAKELLIKTGVLSSQEERKAVSRVLNAAALTYVAAALTSIATLIYFLLRAGFIGSSEE